MQEETRGKAVAHKRLEERMQEEHKTGRKQKESVYARLEAKASKLKQEISASAKENKIKKSRSSDQHVGGGSGAE